MRKITSVALCLVMALSICFFPVHQVYGAGLSVSVSKSSVKIGETVDVTVSVPSGYLAVIELKFDSCFTINKGTVSYGTNGNVATFTIGDAAQQPNSATITFQAKAEGTANFSAHASSAGDREANPVSLDGASASVTVANQSAGGNEGSAVKSADNSLSTLTLSAGTLSPAFVYNTTKYTAVVDYNVTNIAITAKTSNAKAVIESVTGNENLAVGENTITIVVRAENGVTATYTITVTRKAQETTNPENPQEPENPQNPSPEEPDPNAKEPEFSYNGKSLKSVDEIPEEVIPADFSSDTIYVEQKQIPCLVFEAGEVTLLYLEEKERAEDEPEEGLLFVYDEAQNTIYPFIKLLSELGYVMVLFPQVEAIPEGYTETLLSIEGKGRITAYQRPSQEMQTGADEESDYYLIYCMNYLGETGWYQYDSQEGTYQRYLKRGTETSVQEEPVEDPDSAAAYNKLQQEMKQVRQKDMLIICILIFVIAVLVVVIINLLVFRRRDTDGDEEEFDEDMPFRAGNVPEEEADWEADPEEMEKENRRKAEAKFYEIGPKKSVSWEEKEPIPEALQKKTVPQETKEIRGKFREEVEEVSDKSAEPEVQEKAATEEKTASKEKTAPEEKTEPDGIGAPEEAKGTGISDTEDDSDIEFIDL